MPKEPTETIAVGFDTNYWDLYPRLEDVSLESLEPVPEGVGLRLKLHSTKEESFRISPKAISPAL